MNGLRFRTNLQVQQLGPDSYCVLSEYETFLLEGVALKYLIPLIDGSRSYDEIVQRTAGIVGTDNVAQALSMLLKTGYLENAQTAGPVGINSFLAEIGTNYSDAKIAMNNTSIGLINLSNRPSGQMLTYFNDSGIKITNDASVYIVICDDYRDPRIDTINREFFHQKRPWLISKPHGHNYWIGPYFSNPEGPCWACLDTRLTRNRLFLRFSEALSNSRELICLNIESIDSSLAQAMGALVNQVLRICLNRYNPILNTHLCVFDTLNISSTWHYVTRRPECHVCGASVPGAPANAYRAITNSFAETLLGGSRLESVDVTFERFRHHVSSITGVVSTLEPSPLNLTTPIRIFSAGHNFALGHSGPTVLRDTVRAFSSGKGRTAAEARTSALCEALERYSGVFQGNEGEVVASEKQLGEAAINPEDCMLFSNQQSEDRQKWLDRGSRFHVVPYKFDSGALIEWTSVTSLFSKVRRYLPTSYLYYGYPVDEAKFFCWADSNGCAGGTSFDDACLQGLFELIERDAVSMWWYNQYNAPAANPTLCNDPYYDGLHEYYKRIGREYWVLDLPNDFDVPVYCAFL